MERIGIPDGSNMGPRNMRCPGALLVVDREGFRELAKHGHAWSSGIDDLPPEGKGGARVWCSEDVATVTRHHGTYPMGLCARCGTMEANQRKDFARRAAEGQGRR